MFPCYLQGHCRRESVKMSVNVNIFGCRSCCFLLFFYMRCVAKLLSFCYLFNLHFVSYVKVKKEAHVAAEWLYYVSMMDRGNAWIRLGVIHYWNNW